MTECGKLSALIIGLGLAPHEGFEMVFLQQAAGKLNYMGTPERRSTCVWTIKEYSRRMLNKARLLTRPTLARRDAPYPMQGRSSEAYPRFTFHTSRFKVLGSEARTPLADFFSNLLRYPVRRISGRN